MTGERRTQRARWRQRLAEIIYGVDTPAGRSFDVALLWAILISVAAVVLDSVEWIHLAFGPLLVGLEWVLTIGFTIEYVVRLIVARRAWNYARSFYGVVDLLSILPTYVSLFVGGTETLAVVRGLRLLRVFRVFKLARYVGEASQLADALRASRPKIVVFVGTVLTSVLIIGTIMYLIEPPEAGFTSIPQGVYWAIVTLTTVGYGDIAPVSTLGRIFAAVVMILGYGVIAVPTGVLSVELAQVKRRQGARPEDACPRCEEAGHMADAQFCRLCGAHLHADR